MTDYLTEKAARDAGEVVYRNFGGSQAWCLCSGCTAQHASKNSRRTRHDRWALDGQDWRIRADVRRPA